METSSIVSYNEKILDILSKTNRQISCKLFDRLDYKKKIQTSSIEENEDVKYWEHIFCNFSGESLRGQVEKQIFFVTTGRMYNKIMDSLLRRYISSDANILITNMRKINFDILFAAIRIIQGKIRGRNMSKFMGTIGKVMDDNFRNFSDVHLKYGSDVLFYLLNLCVHSVDGLRIMVNEETDMRNVYEVYRGKVSYTRDGILNLHQQLLGQLGECGIPFDLSDLSEYELDVRLVLDMRAKKTQIGYRADFLPLFFHKGTVDFLNNRKHDKILNNVGTYLRTFRVFLETKIMPEDRHRYLLAGSVTKALYNIRDCSDVDFFVMDHEDNIEKYGTYKPQMGCGTVFDDFGKTHYGNEKYYFPMIPAMYDAQQEFKKNRVISDDAKTILDNYPLYSVSGLKAGRYVDIFVGLSRKLGYAINNLDDLLSDPACKIYFFGCPIINLKLEMVRDNVKDIDLGRLSRKQYYDMDYLKKNYGYLFSDDEMEILGFHRLRTNSMESLVKLELNCYHCENEEFAGAGYDLMIRRYPLYLEDIMKTMIRNGPLLISDENERSIYEMRHIYQKPLLSSLKDKMEYREQEMDVEYYYEVSSDGEISIYIGKEISIYEKICVSGNIKVSIDGTTKKLSINVGGKKMKKIYQQITTTDKKKEYRMMLINLMKNFIQLHKMVDSHTIERVVVDILK